jgi:hypothetical protein
MKERVGNKVVGGGGRRRPKTMKIQHYIKLNIIKMRFTVHTLALYFSTFRSVPH